MRKVNQGLRRVFDELRVMHNRGVAKHPKFPITCPNPKCGMEFNVPVDFIFSAAGELYANARTKFRGAHKVYYRCGCNKVFTAREMRAHICPEKPPRSAIKPMSDKAVADWKATLTPSQLRKFDIAD